MADKSYQTVEEVEAKRAAKRQHQAECRRLAHEYVIACIQGGFLKHTVSGEEDVRVGLAYADALIAATTSESEAKS